MAERHLQGLLLEAIYAQNIDWLRKALELGADPTQLEASGESPLWIAYDSYHPQPPFFDLILSYSDAAAPLTHKNQYLPHLYLAAKEFDRFLEIYKPSRELLEAGFGEEGSLLHLAARSLCDEVFDLVYSDYLNLPFYQEYPSKYLFFFDSLRSNDLATVQKAKNLFAPEPGKISATGGKTVWDHIHSSPKPEILDYLVGDCGFDPNQPNANGYALLHKLAVTQSASLSYVLDRFPANPDAQTNAGRTPLMLLLRSENMVDDKIFGLLSDLVEHSSDFSLRCLLGMSARDWLEHCSAKGYISSDRRELLKLKIQGREARLQATSLHSLISKNIARESGSPSL